MPRFSLSVMVDNVMLIGESLVGDRADAAHVSPYFDPAVAAAVGP